MEKKIEPEIDNTMFRVENTGRDRKKEKTAILQFKIKQKMILRIEV